MAPYFSDDKIARALIIAAGRLRGKIEKSRLRKDSCINEPTDSDNRKRIYVIFPKKQENRLIEEISRYYAFYLRNNPVVETRQFYFEDKVEQKKYEMLHGKQMVVVLENKKRDWIKYVKFGGSYNPAEGHTICGK